MVSIATIQPGLPKGKAIIDYVRANGCGCISIKLYLQQVVGQSRVLGSGLGGGALDLRMESRAWESDFTAHVTWVGFPPRRSLSSTSKTQGRCHPCAKVVGESDA